MTRPGVRLRSFFAGWCGEKMMRQRVDPAIADLQAEYAEAGREGRTWRRRRVLVAGYIALARLSVYCAWQSVGEVVREWTAGDSRALVRLLAACGLFTTAIAAFNIWNSAQSYFALPEVHRSVLLFLVPSSLATAVPLGLMFGLLWRIDGGASRAARSAAVACVAAASLVTLANIGWITPASNQSFRTEVFAATGGVGDVRKGQSELTFSELGQRVRAGRTMDAGEGPDVRIAYYSRWALVLSPVLLAVVALSVRRRARSRRMTIGVGTMALWWLAFMVGPRLAQFAVGRSM